MIKTLIEVLQEKKADGYLLQEAAIVSDEFFFIKHQLDMNRHKEVKHLMLTVYKKSEDGNYLGSSSQEIHPHTDRVTLEKIVDQLLYAAAFVQNPYYELPLPQKVAEPKSTAVDSLAIAKDIIEAIQSVQENAHQNINSYEVFVNQKQIHILNSKGVDVRYDTIQSQAEVIVNANKDNHEIELFRDYHFSLCDKEELKQKLTDTLRMGKDRTEAKDTPQLQKSTVLLSGDNVVILLGYYAELTNVASVYMQLSNYQLNQPVTDKVITGDRITLTGLKELPNSSRNAPYDEDGNPITDRVLIENSIVKDYWGSEQYSQYVGKSKASILRNFKVNGGSKSAQEFRKAPYLETLEFSDFQCDSNTGDFAGEIRLAYYFDGEKTIPVTGGSISGNIKEVEASMLLSKETVRYDNYEVPETVCLYQVNVTGI